jgi:hypothetical protein
VRCAALAVLASLALAAPAGAACTPWEVRTVKDGLGSLENLEFDGRGGLLLSASTQDAIVRLTPDGAVAPLVTGVNAPGGMRVRGSVLYFNTGDSADAGLTNRADGTLDRFDLDTRRRETYARGLTMPNGLAFLPDGDAVVSRDLGRGTGITRIPASDPGRPQPNWARFDDTNGLAVDPSGTWLYAVETFTAESRVYRVNIADPSRIEVVATLGGVGVPKGLDDMTIDSAGTLYITANGAGEVIRLNPATEEACVIATGLMNPSAIKQGAGDGWSGERFYVSAFDGTVRELVPPPGEAPPPLRAEQAAPPVSAVGPPGLRLRTRTRRLGPLRRGRLEAEAFREDGGVEVSAVLRLTARRRGARVAITALPCTRSGQCRPARRRTTSVRTVEAGRTRISATFLLRSTSCARLDVVVRRGRKAVSLPLRRPLLCPEG